VSPVEQLDYDFGMLFAFVEVVYERDTVAHHAVYTVLLSEGGLFHMHSEEYWLIY
jgi:hypothetical protein